MNTQLNRHFETVFRNSKFILTEGAIVERLKNEYHILLDKYINHAGLIYDAHDILAALYRQYIEIARKFKIPIMLMTPTRKVNYETLNNSIYHDKEIIADSCTFLYNIRNQYNDFSDHIFIGGLLGCKGNAYQADDELSRTEAYTFHKVQVDQFKKQQPDFLFAGIMPSFNETIGMSQAMAESGLPYIISFMIRKDGRLIDTTSINEAIRIIDNEVHPQPLCYMTNCVHPLNVKLALTNEINSNITYRNRFIGIQANASSLSPEELDQRNKLHQENFDEMVEHIHVLQKEFGFRIFGGCCGTNDYFIEKLAYMLFNGIIKC